MQSATKLSVILRQRVLVVGDLFNKPSRKTKESGSGAHTFAKNAALISLSINKLWDEAPLAGLVYARARNGLMS
jgi:hypothetical protein